MSNLHQQVHRGSRMRAHGRERIASVATILPTVSLLFYPAASVLRVSRSDNRSNSHQQVHRDAQRPLRSFCFCHFLTSNFKVVSLFFSIPLASRGKETCRTCICKFTEARSAPSEAVFAATFLQVVSRLFQHTASISSRFAVR